MSSNTTLLIKQAQILFPDGNFLLGDTKIEKGKIPQIAPEIVPRDTDRGRQSLTSPTLQKRGTSNEIAEATGLILLPGVIDPQVHFREPRLEHKEDLFTASLACVKGGVTSFIEMPNTNPLTITQAALDDKLQRAANKCLVNYGFFMRATAENFPDLLEANPSCGIENLMSSSRGALLISAEEEIEPVFAKGKPSIAVHVEDQARIREKYSVTDFSDISEAEILREGDGT